MCNAALGVVVPKPKLFVAVSNVKPDNPLTSVSEFICTFDVVDMSLVNAANLFSIAVFDELTCRT